VTGLVLAASWGGIALAAFVVLIVLAVGFSYYSRTGTDITQTPYADQSGDAPESKNPSDLAHDRAQDMDNWTHGTK
jgi:hypothetical protein